MLSVQQFVPQSVCLSCQGCCRYAERASVWAPVFLFEEIVELTQKNILPVCLFTHPGIHKKEAVPIDLIETENGFFCPCFDEKENKCKIYAFRPLDCQLYPFLLSRRGKEVYLALDHHCPYTREPGAASTIKKAAAEIAEFLNSKEFLKIAAANPEIFQEYKGDIEFLIPLPQLSQCLYGSSSTQR